MKKRTLIFGNGTLHRKFLTEIRPGDFIIGVDRAAYWLLAHRILPDIAIGDFDSATEKEFNLIKKSIASVQRYPAKKNFTDMELALTHARGDTVVFGWSGSRFDHTLANLFLSGTRTLVNETNRIRLAGRGKTIVQRSSYRYVSIIPYTNSIRVSLTGFLYNVRQKTIKRGATRGISNELAGKQGTIELFSGRAWVIESND